MRVLVTGATGNVGRHTVSSLTEAGETDPSWLGPANLVSLGLATAALGLMLESERRREVA